MTKKVRAQTLQQRFGFADPDLTTPQHDMILLWLNENVSDVCARILKRQQKAKVLDPEVTRGLRDQANEFVCRQREFAEKWNRESDLAVFEADWDIGTPPECQTFEVNRVEFEAPVMNGKYMIGFIDVVVSCSYDCSLHIWGLDQQIENPRVPWWGFNCKHTDIAFEIKSRVPSLGEVLRQINMYREYKPARYVIVSPDARWKDMLEQQGVGFVEAPKG